MRRRIETIVKNFHRGFSEQWCIDALIYLGVDEEHAHRLLVCDIASSEFVSIVEFYA